MQITNADDLASIDFAKSGGLVPVIVQHYTTGEVLMLGFADEEALRRGLSTRELWLYSRSRQRYWRKGESSGNTQSVLAMHLDCDGDAVLVSVEPNGPVCHTGNRSCFGAPPLLSELSAVIVARAQGEVASSYTARLLADENLRLKKLGEEAVELALACAGGNKDGVAEESADVLYHILVAAAGAGVSFEQILGRLRDRRSSSEGKG